MNLIPLLSAFVLLWRRWHGVPVVDALKIPLLRGGVFIIIINFINLLRGSKSGRLKSLPYEYINIHPRLAGFPLPAYRRQAKGDKNTIS
jgi:hypothetical protein